MAKFNSRLQTAGAARTATGPIKAGSLTQRTGNGAPAFSRDAKSDLFLLAVTNFVGENTSYESGQNRDTRFEQLVHQVTAEDPAWMQGFIPWLRTEAMMRSASIVAAAEYVKAGGPLGRQVVASAIGRADEPSEMLAYWIARHGRKLPQPIKRGVADAAQKFYNERNVLKYDSNAASVKMADVIQLAHVKPKADWQSTLFKHVLADRYSNDSEKAETLAALPMLAENRRLRSMAPATARLLLLGDNDIMAKAGMTWESLSSFGPMDKDAWESIIPQMGYMALLRNLRNFDQAGVSDEVAELVINKLKDPEEVVRSRQLPFRFWSAYKNAPSLRWSYALEKGLDLSCQNVPTFTGKTLLLVDTSGSMQSGGYGSRSSMSPIQAAALFGAVLAKKNAKNVRLFGFADYSFEHKINAGESALVIAQRFMDRVGEAGYGTQIGQALSQWNGEDRVVIISDLQSSDYYSRASDGRITDRETTRGYNYGYGSRIASMPVGTAVPTKVPIYAFNLSGNAATSVKSGDLTANEHEFGGMNDRTFAMINLIEQAKSAGYPWEA